jgi:DNA invertase Pin-like site-specific DNA recombinase
MPKRKLKRPDSNIKRKRKFTRRNRKLIYEALRTGLSIGKAIELAGLDRSTYYRWMEKGKDKRNPVHVRFRNHVIRIHAKLEMEKINTIRKVAQGGYELTETRIRYNKTGRIALMKTVKTTEDYGKKKQSLDNATPAERAVQIKAAFDAMMASVPTVPHE